MRPSSAGTSGPEQTLPPNDPNRASNLAKPTYMHPKSTVGDANDSSNDTSRASILVSEVIQSAKTAADNALNWAEKKAGTLELEKEHLGPYSSPATCMPSDLDAIANGILPSMPSKSQRDGGTEKHGKEA